jgi:hypothetical protein
MYENINCGGWRAGVSSTTDASDMRHSSGGGMGAKINDMVSSIVLGQGIKCTFYKDNNFAGSSFAMTKGTLADLRQRMERQEQFRQVHSLESMGAKLAGRCPDMRPARS